jgi:hypothetical protein
MRRFGTYKRAKFSKKVPQVLLCPSLRMMPRLLVGPAEITGDQMVAIGARLAVADG